MTAQICNVIEDNGKDAEKPRRSSVEVRVPASTSNLGAGFDCFGLALQLYLTVRASVAPEDSTQPCRIRSRGEDESRALPRTGENLIFQAMCLAAERQNLKLPPVRLAIHNGIPLGRGLGSSAAAIIAGITLCAKLCDVEMPTGAMLRYAVEIEGHPDNAAAALLGGWVTTCTNHNGDVLAIKRRWPSDLKVVVVSPQVSLQTKKARAALPDTVPHVDAVFNLQRAALFGAALEGGAYDLLWEAMQDRLHQKHRQTLVPGLAEALATPPLDGLVGLALSGAGPSVLALAQGNFSAVGSVIADCFHRHGISTTVRLLDVDNDGPLARTGK